MKTIENVLVNDEFLRLENFDQLTEASSKFSYENDEIEFNLDLNDDGEVTIDGEKFGITRSGIVSVCRRLKIPNPFAKRIPLSLLQENIHTLQAQYGEPVQIFYREINGRNTIVSLCRDDVVSMPHESFIPFARENFKEFNRGYISDTQLELDVVDTLVDQTGIIKLKKGDAVKIGMRLTTSASGYTFPHANLLLFQLSCTNGMVTPRSMGFAKCRLKRGRDIEVSLKNFESQFAELIETSDQVKEQYQLLHNNLDANDFTRYWRGINKIIQDDEVTDEVIFQVDKDVRKEIMSGARAFRRKQREALPEVNLTGYTLTYNLTLEAQQFEPRIQSELEEYAGKIFAQSPDA